MEKRYPGFSKLTDPNMAVKLMHDVFRDWGASASNLGRARDLISGAGAGGALKTGAGVDPRAINPQLMDIMQHAVADLPKGYTATITSGARTGGLEGSQHHGGNAMDIQLYGPDGKPIGNRGKDVTGMYRQLAQDALAEQMRIYPALKGRLGWGGNFETSPGSGVADLMHYDLGGDRGKYGRLLGGGQLGANVTHNVDMGDKTASLTQNNHFYGGGSDDSSHRRLAGVLNREAGWMPANAKALLS